MKKILLLLCVLTLASVGGCSGSQEIVEPNRDDFITGEVQTFTAPVGATTDE